MWDCGRATARNVVNLCAAVFLEFQQRLMDIVAKLGARNKLIVVRRIKWDETSEPLSFSGGICATAHQTRGSWHVLVQRQQYIFGYCDGDDRLQVSGLVQTK